MIRYCIPILLLTSATVGCAVEHPVLAISLDESQADSLRGAVAPLTEMTEEQMLDLIPTQSGLYFVGCLNCTGGQQDNQMREGWSIEEPDVARCTFCGHVYPSDTYPTTGALEVQTPAGGVARYPYHEGRPHWWKEDGPYRSFFHARVDYHKIRYMETAAGRLARLYRISGDAEIGRRAALILHRFAEVFPHYCYHYDYPFRPKVIYEGEVDPSEFRSGYRTARWTWWAYMDISRPLLEAYDLLTGTEALEALAAEKNTDVDADIRDVLITMTEQVIANRDDLTNMSPGMWADFIRVGRVLGTPDYVHTAVNRMRRLATEQFFYDGVWVEGAPSYHSQVMGGLSNVFTAAKGYSDPAGYANQETGERFDDLDIEGDVPEVSRARTALMRMRLPDGRFSPVHDTWWTNRSGGPMTQSQPDLLPAIGHAILGTGSGESQIQAHLTWSPGYGHRHYDGLSLLLWANGHELLSDIGYTHTAWREWTVQSPGHNLVVVDQANQVADRTTYGHLRYFVPGQGVQVVSVDNAQVYPGVTDLYRRTIALVQIDETSSYLLDVFQVEGGHLHDYLLHGSADVAQTLSADIELSPRGTLVPTGVQFTAGRNEQDFNSAPGHAYGYMRDLQSTRVDDTRLVRVDYRNTDDAVGLRVYTVAEAGDEVVLGTAPSVRQAGSDDGLLDQYHRGFSMLRREGGASLFASVIVPFADEPVLDGVKLVDIPGAELAIELTVGGRTDLILINAVGVDAQWRGLPLQAQTELAVLSASGDEDVAGMVVAGDIVWSGSRLATGGPVSRELVAVERDSAGGSLLVAGEFLPPAGAVITVDHGGGRTSPYTVVSSSIEGGNSRLNLIEDPGFEYDAAERSSTFVFMPRETYRGPHTVGLMPVVQMTTAP